MGVVIEPLDDAGIEALLRSQVVGRIGCHTGGRTYVVPVIYAWDGEAVHVVSIPGRKIEMMRANPNVCFEVDEHRGAGSWRSVIVEGVYEESDGDAAARTLALLVERFGGRRRAERRGGGLPPVVFRIRPTAITGRRVGGAVPAAGRLAPRLVRLAARLR